MIEIIFQAVGMAALICLLVAGLVTVADKGPSFFRRNDGRLPMESVRDWKCPVCDTWLLRTSDGTRFCRGFEAECFSHAKQHFHLKCRVCKWEGLGRPVEDVS